jgi:hypothetical protein
MSTAALDTKIESAVEPKPVAALELRKREYRQAKAVLVTLLVLAVLVQIPSIFVARIAAHAIWAGADAGTLWEEYRAKPAPEVLFLGASSTRADIDVEALSASLSRRTGRAITVGKFGLNGEGPDFYVAALYRIMRLPTRPHVVVLQVDSLLFTAKDVLDPTRDLWLMSDPIDAGYMQTALRIDPTSPQLVLDWTVPFFATYPLISLGARCPFTVGARTLTRRAHLPTANIVKQPTPCEEGAHPSADALMTQEEEQQVRGNWAGYLNNYHFSERKAAFLREATAMVRAGGAVPILLAYPSYQLRTVNPAGEGQFQAGIRQLATSLQVPLLDLGNYVITDPNLWADPAHLNRWGAQAFSPVLAEAVASNYP